MFELSKEFGSMVFNDETMRARLPRETYQALKKTSEDGRDLDRSVAEVVANAMKDWAVEKGVTHFTHWFQPMTGITAEKHDSFISPTADGRIIMEFSGKELIKGEPDASSFPSGGLRATFEARGYTAWDPTSFAFIKDNILCIPTAFCSYGGEALDMKTPLLRSMQALDKQAVRLMKLLGKDDVKRVASTVGPEQEYFLIDKSVYDKRRDLIYCHRTLFGAPPPKGQELEDHYFGSVKPRVAAFMADLDKELWKIGVLAKTKHNEVAPAQHELAPVFTTANIAADHNQLTMELMRKVANRHGMECLLHEKPFAGINGSGKHNNWSLVTDTGENLLNPTSSPKDNLQFLLFLAAIIKAVDEHQDLLRLSVASAGNDHRLGANEAPPAIISIFLGANLTQVLESIENRCEYSDADECREIDVGVKSLPNFSKDTSDRNRTSPFAFTGNKFEFRMLGSSLSISGPNIMLNTIVADTLSQFADEIEKSGGAELQIRELVRKTVKAHKRILFNGNNYSDEWVKEAEKRGLLNLKSTADALPYFVSDENVALFERHGVFSKTEIASRCEIVLEEYCKILNIEAITMLQMSRKSIIPAVSIYTKQLARTALLKKKLGDDVNTDVEEALTKELSSLLSDFFKAVGKLDKALNQAKEYTDPEKAAKYYRKRVFAAMQEVRELSDSMEIKVSKTIWPWPTYGDLLFSI
jgi:glutamine synthetase